MVEKIKIRPALAEDYGAYCALVDEVDALHTRNEPRDFQYPGAPPRKREFYESLLAASDKDVLLAEVDGVIAAYPHLETRKVEGPGILVPQSYCYVSDIVVAGPFQRRGLGRAMMAHAENWAKQHGLDQIRLNVRAFNTSAIRFYESLGMKAAAHTMLKRL